MALRKEIYAFSLSIIVLVILFACIVVEPSTGQQSKVNDISGNIFFTNSTATYKIENVVTHWSVEYPNQLQVNFSMYEDPFRVIYSLDQLANITTIGNFTLMELKGGIHYLTLYVTDKSGNTAYQTYHINLPEQTPFYEIAPYLEPALALFIIVALLIVYYKQNQSKRKLTK